jgi:membrane protease YdiL (CAAX protease family)
MSDLIDIKGVIGIVILSVISAFLVGSIIIGAFTSPHDEIHKLYLYISFFLGQGVIVVPPIYYLNYKKQSLIKSFRIKIVSIKTIKYSIIFSFGVIALFDTLDKVIHIIIPAPEYIVDLGKMMQPDSTLGLIFLFLAIIIIAPIGEEIVFRGFLQKFLEEHWLDITKAILVTSLFFAVIHFNPFWIIQIYLLGIILGFLSWKTKSIIPSIILHSLNNSIALVSTTFPKLDQNFFFLNSNISPPIIIIAIFLIRYSLKNINQLYS